MSIFDYMFDNEFKQRADIERLRERSRRQQQTVSRRRRKARGQAEDFKEQIEDLEEQVGSLQLINRAMIAMMKEQSQWDDKRFKELVYDLDMEDGKLDGK